ncbi:sulfite exporter TauE/SafE family protein [Pseudomonadota bacterium]
MVEIDTTAMTFSLAMGMGLVFGLGPCNISCLPYLGPVFLARDGGLKHSWRTIVPFSMGRLSGYTLLGLFAGLTGQIIDERLDTPWVPMILGGATILVGLSLLFSNKPMSGCSSSSVTSSRFSKFIPKLNIKRFLPDGLFFMGFGMALNPCAPLNKVILAASATTSAIAGFTLGLGFGLGAILVPAVVFGVGMAYVGNQLRAQMAEWRTTLERTSAVMLIFMGSGIFIF